MTIRSSASLISAALLCAAITPALQARAAERVASTQIIPAWYTVARTAPATPVQMARVLAMVHTAMHDAVNAAEPRYKTYVSDITDRNADAETAAAAAAHRVLSGLFPAQQAAWDAALANSQAALADGARKQAGLMLGAAVGQMMLDVRANDGWNAVDSFNPAPAPGVWKPTPPSFAPMAEPQFYNVKPFTIVSGNHFPLGPPPALDTVEYQRLFDEVYSIGRDKSANRNEDQTHQAHFWFEPPYDGWTRIARMLATDKRYDLHQTARLYALVNMVSFDGLIAGWYWKRHYAFWRPITAIHEANTDNNPHTQADPAWTPLRATAFHPDHPSTHSVLGAAAAEVIRRFTGSDHHKFCMTTLTAIPVASTRCFERLSQAQEENTNSRVYVGLHFRSATQAGDRLGRRIGRFAFERTLLPLAGRGRVHDDQPADAD